MATKDEIKREPRKKLTLKRGPATASSIAQYASSRASAGRVRREFSICINEGYL